MGNVTSLRGKRMKGNGRSQSKSWTRQKEKEKRGNLRLGRGKASKEKTSQIHNDEKDTAEHPPRNGKKRAASLPNADVT